MLKKVNNDSQLNELIHDDNTKLKIELQKYKMFSDESDSAIFIIEQNGEIIDVNLAATRIYGYSHDEFLMIKIFDLRSEDNQDVVRSQMDLADKKEISFEAVHVCKDGKLINVIVKSKRINIGNRRFLLSVTSDITERKRTENEHRDREIKYRTLFDTAEGAILLFTNGKWVDCNSKALEIFGCTREQIIGEHPINFSPLKQPSGLNSDEEARRIIDLVYSEGPQYFEWVHSKADGTLFDAEVSLKRLDIEGESFIQSIVLDVSGKKLAKKALNRAQILNQAIVESTSDLIWTVDPKTFGLLSFNQALINHFKKANICITLGSRPEDMFVEKDFHDIWHNFYNRALNEGQFSIEYGTYRGNSRLLLNFGLLKHDDQVFGISVFGKNITIEHEYKKQLEETNITLVKRIQQSIRTISRIGELRDVYTAGHQKRVSELSCAIAKEMGLSDDLIENISLGALIHDIGKICIASEILNKPGNITDLEYQMLQTHVEQGYSVLSEIDFSDKIKMMIYQHHERLDGSGYPQKLKGEQIILESRILAVADVVEAMTSHRPYRPALGIEMAMNEIAANRGTKFDPNVVDVCMKLFSEKWSFSEQI